MSKRGATPGFDKNFASTPLNQFDVNQIKKDQYRTKIPHEVLKRLHRKSTTACVSPHNNNLN
jgi:hypothetical protein